MLVIELGEWWRSGFGDAGTEGFEEVFSASGATAHVEDDHFCGAEYEGGELFRFAEATGAESFEDGDDDLLGEILGGVAIAEVAEAVEMDAGSHAAEEFGFRGGVAGGDSEGEGRVIKGGDFHCYTFYV